MPLSFLHLLHRRLQQLEAEVKRVQDNATLGQDEKMKIMRDKHSAIMRPVLVALERICEFTSQTPETPHEEWFQKTYSKMLEKAFDALKHPSDPRKPRQCWMPFKEVRLVALCGARQKLLSTLMYGLFPVGLTLS